MSLKITSNKILHRWINAYDCFKARIDKELRIIAIKIVSNI